MKQTLHFSKYQGLGNDFILLDGINQRIELAVLKKEVPLLCHRHFGIGADGLILATASKTCDIKMTVFNQDGSVPEMCGNGLRCFAQFVFEKGLVDKEVFSVETKAGKMVPALVIKQGHVEAVEVDMGLPQHDAVMMPRTGLVHKQSFQVEDASYEAYLVSMGNPHAVIFVEGALSDDEHRALTQRCGKAFQTMDPFVNGVNVEVVVIRSESEVDCKVYERGVGLTLACGTGACAVVVAGVHSKKLTHKVTVNLPGGALLIEWQESDQHVIKVGPSKRLFVGQVVL